MTAPGGYRHKVDLELTRRQRDVLRLIAAGKTNPEIAEELGIGYESVKSHVSEVLGKLGVDRREEAAAWWREEHTPRRRVARFGAGILAFLPRGAGAGATAVALLMVGVLFVVVLLRRGDGGTVPVTRATDPAAPTQGPSLTATAGPASTATAGPGSTATAAAVVVPSVVAGKVVKTLVPGPPIPFPSNVIAYVAVSSCFACGWAPGDLWRLYRGRDGAMVADHIGPGGYVPLYAISNDGSLLIAGLCSSYCGGEGNPEPDAVLQFYSSRDGGITWQAIEGASLTGVGAWIGGWYGDQLVVNVLTIAPSTGSIKRYDALLLPSLRPLAPPASLALPDTGAPAVVGPGGILLWYVRSGAADPNWSGAFAGLDSVVPGVEWESRTYGETSPGTTAGVWRMRPSEPWFFVEVDGAGTPVGGYLAGVEDVTFAGRLLATSWLGTAALPLEDGEPPVEGQSNVRAVVIDVAAGQLRPITELRRDVIPIPLPADWRTYAWPRVALTGAFWRVSTGGDCLHVRQEPSTASPTLGCFHDGVLLRERDAGASDGWRAVATPDGRDGFAASEYLQ